MTRPAVLIPVHDGGDRLKEVVAAVLVQPVDVLVLDDGSTDGVPDACAALGAEVTRLPICRGKGAAVREGLRLLLSRTPRPPWIVLMDGDGQHLPEELPRFLERMGGEVDLLLGSRMEQVELIPTKRRITNRAGSRILKFFTGQAVPDTQCGYRALEAGLASRLDLESTGYELETEMLLKALRLGARWEVVPVSAVYDGEPSHFRPVMDTYRISMAALRYVR